MILAWSLRCGVMGDIVTSLCEDDTVSAHDNIGDSLRCPDLLRLRPPAALEVAASVAATWSWLPAARSAGGDSDSLLAGDAGDTVGSDGSRGTVSADDTVDDSVRCPDLLRQRPPAALEVPASVAAT